MTRRRFRYPAILLFVAAIVLTFQNCGQLRSAINSVTSIAASSENNSEDRRETPDNNPGDRSETPATGPLSAASDSGYDIIVIAGQSNTYAGMYSAGFLDTQKNPVDSLIFQIGRYQAEDLTIIPATDRLQHWDWVPHIATVGFGMTFARHYVSDHLAPGRRVLIVPGGMGSTSILDWAETVPSDQKPLYQDLLKRIQLALNAPGKNRIVALLWQQGENDINKCIASPTCGQNSDLNADQYAQKLAEFLSKLRTNFKAQGLFPILAGEPVPAWQAGNVVKEAFLNQAIRKVNTLAPHMAWYVSAEGLSSNYQAGLSTNPAEVIHFDALSQVQLGKRYYETFRAISSNWNFLRVQDVATHSFTGIGVNFIFPTTASSIPAIDNAPIFNEVIDPLGIKSIRVDLGAPWGPADQPTLNWPAESAPSSEWDAFAAQALNYPWTNNLRFDLEAIRPFMQSLRARRITVIQTMYHSPATFQIATTGDGAVFDSTRVRSQAQLMAAQLKWQYEHQVHPDFFEPLNEPNGEWGQYLSPSIYAKFIYELGKALDERGLRGIIKVIGAGGTTTVTANSEFEYLKFLTDPLSGTTERPYYAMSGFSYHSYEYVHSGGAYDSRNRLSLTPMREYKRWMAPEFPLFVTEFCGLIEKYQLGNFETSGYQGLSAEKLHHVGLAILANAANLINAGASQALLWEAKDHDWNPRKFGLLDDANHPKTEILRPLKAIFPKLPVGAKVLSSGRISETDSEVSHLALKSGNDVVVLIVNLSATETKDSHVQLTTELGARIFKQTLVTPLEITAQSVDSQPGDLVTFKLPPKSALLIEARK